MQQRRRWIFRTIGAAALLAAFVMFEPFGLMTTTGQIVGHVLPTELSSSALSLGFSRDKVATIPGPGGGPHVTLQLRDAEPASNPPANPPKAGSPLSPARIDALLDRLPDLAKESIAQSPFHVRTGTKSPRRTGDEGTPPFPHPQGEKAPPKPSGGSLHVTRYAPEGAVSMAATLNISFSEPMVAVGSIQDALPQDIVTLTPHPAGRWRWLGTQTLIFEPTVRFPAATKYRVLVPAGTVAASGNRLDVEIAFEFKTPPAKLISKYPVTESVVLTPLLLMTFDQRVDAKALLEFVHLKDHKKERKLRIATPAEIEADPYAKKQTEHAEPGRWIAFTPKSPLKPGRKFEVTIEAGAPSAEGPRKTQGSQGFSFSTYDKLAVDDYSCSEEGSCQPGRRWWVRFNNALDPNQEVDIKVEPDVANLEVNFHQQHLSIAGDIQPKTSYRIVVPKGIRDTFGQTLKHDEQIAITTGHARRRLHGPTGPAVTLAPFGPAVLPIQSTTNKQLSVRINRVEPEDWHAFQQWQQGRVRGNGFARGEVVQDTWRTPDDEDRYSTVDIDLRSHLKGNYGHFAVWVETADRHSARQLLLETQAGNGDRRDHRRWSRLPGSELVYWVQVTKLGLTAVMDSKSIVSWVTALGDGTPVENAEVSLIPPLAATATTDASGLTRQAFAQRADQSAVLIARKGRDSAMLAGYGMRYFGNNQNTPRTLWYKFSDRGVYRPGEEVHLKGWLRHIDAQDHRTLSAPDESIDQVGWKLKGPRGKTIEEGSASVTALGGFHLAVKLPEKIELGNAAFVLTAMKLGEPVEDARSEHAVMIQEFRRPEFEVMARFNDAEHFLGDTAVAHLGAKYFAGGGLAAAPVTWNVTAEYGSFVPPHHDDFQFGNWTPWWGQRPFHQQALENIAHSAVTDAKGEHSLAIDLVAIEKPRPFVVKAEALVQDRNRQNWTGRSQTLVHPAALYVGLNTERSFIQVGESLDVESVVVNIAGERQAGIDVSLHLEESSDFRRHVDPQSTADEEPPTVLELCKIRSESEALTCGFKIEKSGNYRVVASVHDDQGRRNESELQVWVAGANAQLDRALDREHVQLIPDRQEYKPGDVAEVLVQAPFFPAEGLLILGRNGVSRTETFRVTEANYTLRIPILEEHLAGVSVAVELVGESDAQASNDKPAHKRMAFAGGTLELAVPPRSRDLIVLATPQTHTLAPGGKTEIDVQVNDAAGHPLAEAEVALVVVDESVLALTGYTLNDPLDIFYPKAFPGYSTQHLRSQITLATSRHENPPQFEAPMMHSKVSMAAAAGVELDSMDLRAARSLSYAGKAGVAPASPAPIELRRDFSALALFAPVVTTDANGRARVPLQLPDSITRYRIMAVAVSGDRFFGTGESQVTARLPLMVRPSPPRFLNFGDSVELPVTLQNQTDEPMDVDIAIRGTNASFAANDGKSAGVRVSVPGNDRVEVRFAASPTSAGTAAFQVAAATDAATDAASFNFPVWTPATREATATYGVIDDGVMAQPIVIPDAAWPQFGGLEISASSTQLQALTDAMLYLNTYAFKCSEQISSRMLSVIALKDVLDAFAVEGMPDASTLTKRLEEDVETLASIQNADGGFGFWHRGSKSWPYLTIHVAHALARAKTLDLAFDEHPRRQLDRYIANIDQHIKAETSKRTANALRAYALYVRSLSGDLDRKRARSLAREKDLSIESLGWLLPLLKTDAPNNDFDEASRRLANQVTETAAGAHFVTSYSDGAHVLLHSERRADGVVLGGLVATDPENDLIPKLVRGLLAHRKAGRWSNTQENVFILLALSEYFERFESDMPDFVARFWLGDGFAGEHPFKGRSTDRVKLEVPMATLLTTDSPSPLTLQKDGPGRLYYRIGMRYAPKVLVTEAENFGFEVSREYEAVDDPDDVTQGEDNTVRIKAGARVKVTVSMMNPMRRYHVALVDPLPAGLEPINSALATTEQLPSSEDRVGHWWWSRQWYEHENLRDERAEAFTSLLREGVHTYSYFARATTPGEFIAPPARAEEMYHPETFGRSSSFHVIIK
ncbi:MAG: alpha-2-macroglobulin family protein [Myxococcota bacterium]